MEGEGTRLEFLREITMIIVMEEDSMTPQALAWDGGPWAARTEDKEGERGHANAAFNAFLKEKWGYERGGAYSR